MEFDFTFFLLLMTNGVLIGLMYSLIALGFVLVYKATDAINFAQGEFVMMAGYLAALGDFPDKFLARLGRLGRRHGGIRLRCSNEACCGR